MKKYFPFALSAVFACLAVACADAGGSDNMNDDTDKPSKTDTCTPGCKNNILTACDGNEKLTTPCPYGCDESGDSCKQPDSQQPGPTCTSGCEDGILTTCSDNVPTKEKCSNGCNNAGTACKDDEKVELCTPGCKNGKMTSCYGSTPEVVSCSDGCKEDGSACIVVDTCKDTCTAGTLTKCDGTVHACPNGCNEAGNDCQVGGGEGCSYATKCEGNVFWGCLSGFESHYDCADYKQVCTTVDGESNCREACTQEGQKTKKCIGYTTGASTYEYTCTRASDGKLYWNQNPKSANACETGLSCNADYTACETAQSCSYGTTQAACEGNVALACIPSNIINNSNCTDHGQTCVRPTQTTAECIDNTLASCSKAGDKTYRCGIGETTMSDVSIAYTCKKDADGILRYLDGTNELCGNSGCDSKTGLCKKEDAEVGKTCTVGTFNQRCSISEEGYGLAVYCSDTSNTVDTMACNESGEFCLLIHTTTPGNVPDSAGNVADCYKNTAEYKCSNKGETKTVTDDINKLTFECAESSDGTLYWVEVNYTPL